MADLIHIDVHFRAQDDVSAAAEGRINSKSEIVATGPLLLGLQLANQNNNNNATPVPQRYIAEAIYLKNRDDAKLASSKKCCNAAHVAPLFASKPLSDQIQGSGDTRPKIDEDGLLPASVAVKRQYPQADRVEKGIDSYCGQTVLSSNGKPKNCGDGRSIERLNLRISSLTENQIKSYHLNGFLVIPKVITSDEIFALHSEAQEVISRILEGESGVTYYDAASLGAQPSSIGRILATFETTLSPLMSPSSRTIARLGSGVHSLLPHFKNLTHHPFHRSIATSLGCGIKPCITQSQLIVKSANKGGLIVPHQDACVSFTDPPSCLTFWYALEDSTRDNGCLEVAAGSHLTTAVKQRVVKGTHVEVLEKPIWAIGSGETEGREDEYEYQALEVERGTLVLFHGCLLHRSGRNRSGMGRMAYTFSVVDGNRDMPDDSLMKPEEGEVDLL